MSPCHPSAGEKQLVVGVAEIAAIIGLKEQGFIHRIQAFGTLPSGIVWSVQPRPHTLCRNHMVVMA
jgi:hypothetical protein